MHLKKQYIVILFLQTLHLARQITVEENGKDLPSNYNFDELSRRRRPSSGAAGAGCNFNGIRGGKPRTDATGRTFFDLQFLNVDYHYNYDIHCGGGGSSPVTGGANKPILGGGEGEGGVNKPLLHKPHHKPHKPLFGGHGSSGEHTEGGNMENRPLLSLLFGNRPLQGIFSQTQSQSQTGIITGALSGIGDLLPKPQDIGQGLGDGISSFVSTLPQIGQSFQSLLPSFGNFQLPSLPSFPPPTQGGQAPTPGSGGAIPVGPNPTDPDDIIYNDSIKPVHEDHDPVTDPHLTNKLPPDAYYNRNRAQITYQQNKKYQSQKESMYGNRNRYHYQQNGQSYGRNGNTYEGRSLYHEETRDRGRTFRFPS